MLFYSFDEIGSNIYQARKRLGLTQADVAEAAGLSDRTYANIERGLVNMRLKTLLRICEVLHISPDELLVHDTIPADITPTNLVEQLEACNPRDQRTATNILAAYLNSLR